MPDHQPVADDAAEPAERTQRERRDRRWIVVAALVGLPILVLVVSLAQRTWYPTGDQAQAELRMLSLPDRPPLVGAAGRIVDEAGRQGNHPGPLMFWATWPLYELLGGSSWAFEAATALVNLAWLVVSVWLVRRRAGLGIAAWYGVTALGLIGGYGLDALSQPWNPWVSLLPFTVLVLSVWCALRGDRWAVVLAAGAGSYAVQGHAGYIPLVLPLVGVALAAPAWTWWRTRRIGATGPDGSGEPEDDDAPAGRRWLVPTIAAVAVALACWSGPFYDLATNDPSNVDKLIANFGSPDESPIGIGRAVEAMLQSLDPLGPWLFGGLAVEGSILPGLLLVVAWAGVAAEVARRRSHPELTVLNVLVAIALALGTFAVSRIFGALYLYVFRWVVAIAALMAFTLGWGLAALIPRPPAWPQRRVAAVALAALVVLSSVTSVRLHRQEIPYDQSWRMEQALAPEVAAQLRPDRRYLVRWDDPAYLGGLGFGLILDLERRGFEVGALPQFGAAVEPHRVYCPGDWDAVVWVVTGPITIASYDERPDLERIASVDPRPDPAVYDAKVADLREELDRAGRPTSAADLERILNLLALSPDNPQRITDLAGELVLDGVPSAVFLEDPAATPQVLEERTARTEACWD